MVTVDGIGRLKDARRNIELLRERREYLLAKSMAREIETGRGDSEDSFAMREVRALDWALELCEAEWDHLARLRRNVERIEHRQSGLERNGTQDDGRALAWDLP